MTRRNLIWAKRTACTGWVTSAIGLAAVLFASRVQSGASAAALNGSAQSVRGRSATTLRRPSWRITGVALLVHHASSHFWAAVHEHPRVRAAMPDSTLRAALVAAAAGVVDYGILPHRLSPGYEGALDARGIAAVFGALAAGLAVGSLLQRSPRALHAGIARRLCAPGSSR